MAAHCCWHLVRSLVDTYRCLREKEDYAVSASQGTAIYPVPRYKKLKFYRDRHFETLWLFNNLYLHRSDVNVSVVN
jgi:hypothetical protein